MAKQADDLYTLDLLEKPKRGRPKKPDALTPAQRAKAYRERLKADPVRRFDLLIARLDKLKPAVYAEMSARKAAREARDR